MADTNLTINHVETESLILVREFLKEMEAERAIFAITLSANLENDLGLGSLEKAELFRRVEKRFDIHLSQSSFTSINTINDLVRAIQTARPSLKIMPQEFVPKLSETKIDPSRASTLVEVLWEYAQYEPDRPHVYLQDEEGSEKVIRYGQLFEMATAVAEGVTARGLKQGETVAIMLPTCEDFFYAFFGILLAGGIPVPIYPPFRVDQIEEYAKRESLILQNAEVRLLITFERAEGLSKLLSNFITSLKEVITVPLLMTTRNPISSLNIESDDAALIQYTSGSTGNPKGVLLTHKNLLANIRAYGEAINIQPTDVAVSWLPLYHDMGLIGAWLGSLYYGIPVTIMSPLTFLSHPERWLWTIHYHRATLSAGPNFSYELCLRKIADDALIGLDLSSWRIAFNGAEAIYPKTLAGFAKRFAQYGFKSETLFPVYGLAESSVALTFPPLGRTPKIDRIAREPFEKHGTAIPAKAKEKNILEFVYCGKVLTGHEIRVVDENNNILPERKVGNLQFRGPSSMQGYYHNPAATAAIYHEGWWDTGDLAYLADDEIVITGRKKDVIIKAGRNLFPGEIEEIASRVTGIRKGCVVAFGVGDPESGTEKLIVIAETHEIDAKVKKNIANEIRDKIIANVGLPPDNILLVLPHTIPKTSSGKLRRAACRDTYLQNKLSSAAKPTWLQLTTLFGMSIKKKIQNAFIKTVKIVYTGYVDLVFIVTTVLAWVFNIGLSQQHTETLVRYWARFVLFAAGCRVRVTGKENLITDKAVVYVANHASYIDTVALLGIMPPGTAFIAKKELLKTPFLGHFLKKLKHIMVDRLDIMQTLSDTSNIQIAIEEGRSILVFPEGTFTYATGLRPFKLGAFKIAVETNSPICPIAIQGTRKILRSGSRLFRPGVIKIHISEFIYPQDQQFHEIIRLRSAARLVIAKQCGEPTLDLVRAGYNVNIQG